MGCDAARGAGGRLGVRRPCRCHPGPGCGCVARCSPSSTATRSPPRRPPSPRSRRSPTGTATGADDPWFGAGIRTPDEAAEAREWAERLAGGEVDDTARTLADVFRGIQLPDAPTANDWGHVLATVGDVRDTLEVFRPDVFDIPLDDLVTATGSSAYRRSVGSELGWLDRWRLRRQARALLRPGRPPADLHEALAAASEQRIAWRQLAGSGGRPEIPVELDRARAAHAGLVAGLTWLDDHLPGADTSGAATEADAVTRLLDLDLPSLRTRVEALAAAAGRLGVVPAVTTALDGLTASGLRPLVDDLRARAVPAELVTSEVEWVWWSSLSEEIALRDPRVAAHDGRALTRSVGEFAEADRAVVARQRRAGPQRGRRPGRRGRARAPRAGDPPAGRGCPVPPAGAAARPRDALPRPRHGRAAVLGDEPARRRVGAAAGAVVRRRRVRRGLPGAAGRGGVGDLAGPPGRRGRRLAPAAADLVLHHGHRRRPRRGRRRRGDHRGRRVDPRRARRGPAEPSPVVALPLARRAAHRVRQRRGLRGVARHLPRHRHRPGGAPGARSRGRASSARASRRSRPRPPRSTGSSSWCSSTPAPAPTARSASSRWASSTRPGSRRPCATPWPGPTTRCSRSSTRTGPSRSSSRTSSGCRATSATTSCSPSATARPRTAGCCTASARSTSRAASGGSTSRSPGPGGR